VISFFTTSDHALAYQRTHTLDGVVLAFSGAVKAGTLVFGELLNAQKRVS